MFNFTDISTIDKSEDKRKGKTVHVVLCKVLITLLGTEEVSPPPKKSSVKILVKKFK